MDVPFQPAVATVGRAVAVPEADGPDAIGEAAGFDQAHLPIVGMDEVDDRPRAELFDRESESSLPGRVQVLEVAIERRGADQVEGESEVPLDPGLQSAAFVDEPPEQAADGETGARGGQNG